MKFNTRVLSAAWIEETSDWEVNTATETLRCKILISAVGALHKPGLPDISGVGSFEGGQDNVSPSACSLTGPSWHTAQWDHSVSLEGKRVKLSP